MEFLTALSLFLWSIVPGVFIAAFITGIFYFRGTPKYVYKTTGWLPIDQYPIPENIENYLATDGKTVSHMYEVKWGPYGKCIFSKYDKITYITHWMPMPDVPKGNRKTAEYLCEIGRKHENT